MEDSKKTRTRKETKIHKYEVIIDDGQSVFKAYVPGLSEKDVTAKWSGNGEIVRIKDVSAEYLPDAARVRDDLAKMGYGAAEQDFIYRILSQYVEGTV